MYRNTRIYSRSLQLIDLASEVICYLPTGYGFMADQLRRAASSVTLNFAEGCGRATSPDRRRFFTMAQGSANEVAAILDVLARFHAVTLERRRMGLDLCDHLAAMLKRFA